MRETISLVSARLSRVAAAALFPVRIFIGEATRLSAARREQRFAAMRLIGATPRQISMLSTVESSVAAVAGLLASLAVIGSTLPLLNRITGPETARND